MKNRNLRFTIAVALLLPSLTFAAWRGPTLPPTSEGNLSAGNTLEPINVGGGFQTKAGIFQVGQSFQVGGVSKFLGKVGIGEWFRAPVRSPQESLDVAGTISANDFCLRGPDGNTKSDGCLIAGGGLSSSSLKCAPGLPGKDGIDGKDGVDGVNGKDGLNGTNGTNGKDGAPGKCISSGPPGIRSLTAGNNIILSSGGINSTTISNAGTISATTKMIGPCPGNTAMTSIDANGNPTCVAIPGSTSGNVNKQIIEITSNDNSIIVTGSGTSRDISVNRDSFQARIGSKADCMGRGGISRVYRDGSVDCAGTGSGGSTAAPCSIDLARRTITCGTSQIIVP